MVLQFLENFTVSEKYIHIGIFQMSATFHEHYATSIRFKYCFKGYSIHVCVCNRKIQFTKYSNRYADMTNVYMVYKTTDFLVVN